MYVWRRNTDETAIYIRADSDDQRTTEIMSISGPWQGPFPSNVTIWAKEDPERITDYFTYGTMDIVSKRLKELLETDDVSASVEFFPLEVVGGKRVKKPVPSNSFYLMRFLRDFDCFDLERSIYRRVSTWTVRHIDKLVLREEEIPSNVKLFFAFPFVTKIIARDELAEKILAGNFTGIKLTPVAEAKIL